MLQPDSTSEKRKNDDRSEEPLRSPRLGSPQTRMPCGSDAWQKVPPGRKPHQLKKR